VKIINFCFSSKCVFIFISFLIQNTAFAEGVNFIKGESAPRYVESFDSKMGIIVTDNDLKLQFTKCLVGMKSSESDKQCSGNPESLNWSDANAFSKQLGNGWRLPTTQEFESIIVGQGTFSSIRLLLRKYTRSELLSGTPYWTMEQDSDSLGVHWVALCNGLVGPDSSVQEGGVTFTRRRDSENFSFIFVRDLKNNSSKKNKVKK
jgi:hypothetical protein